MFGEVCWPGGVAALLGGAEHAAHVEGRLMSLVEREVLVQRAESRFAREVEIAFRHVLKLLHANPEPDAMGLLAAAFFSITTALVCRRR